MKRVVVFLVLLLILTECNPSVQPSATERPRTIITTDGEVDDMDSFIRMLLHSNEFQIEGLVYSSSQWHYKGDGKGTLFTSEMPGTARRYGERTDLRWPGTNWMQELINKYAAVYMNLKKHDGNFPSPDYLRSIVKTGNINFEGDMKEPTEGSDFIKQVLLDEKEGPVYVEIWGGTNTLARALKSIEEEYRGTSAWDEIYKKVSAKTFIYTILDQDATYTTYVAPTWPDIRVICNSSQFWSFAYAWPMVVPDNLKPYMGGEWFAEHIKFNHGALVENYYLWGDGSRIEGGPDQNGYTVKWWQYMEAGTCRIPVQIEDAASQNTSVTVPENAEPGQTIHLILEVKDDGTPLLTRFARVIITVD